jgi:integrase
MAIVRAPLKTDAAGKCNRWRVIIFNPGMNKQEWHTVKGTRRDAEAFERLQKNRLASGVYIAKSDRRSFAEVAKMFLKERLARDRRTSTSVCYETVFKCHLLPTFGPREVGTIRRPDIADHFDAMREAGAIRILRTMKAVLFFALERELVERNVMQRFRPFEGGKSERHVSRGAFSESEIQAMIVAARPQDRVLIGLLCFTGLRPAEAYALDWSAVDLEAGCLHVLRSWDHRGDKFVEPKTAAGLRVVPLSGWLVSELAAHKERSGLRESRSHDRGERLQRGPDDGP